MDAAPIFFHGEMVRQKIFSETFSYGLSKDSQKLAQKLFRLVWF
jgi:hypothetical protein